MNFLHAKLFPGVATICGFQEDGKGGGFWLYNLLREIPGHPMMSTVTQTTVEAASAEVAS